MPSYTFTVNDTTYCFTVDKSGSVTPHVHQHPNVCTIKGTLIKGFWTDDLVVLLVDQSNGQAPYGPFTVYKILEPFGKSPETRTFPGYEISLCGSAAYVDTDEGLLRVYRYLIDKLTDQADGQIGEFLRARQERLNRQIDRLLVEESVGPQKPEHDLMTIVPFTSQKTFIKDGTIHARRGDHLYKCTKDGVFDGDVRVDRTDKTRTICILKGELVDCEDDVSYPSDLTPSSITDVKYIGTKWLIQSSAHVGAPVPTQYGVMYGPETIWMSGLLIWVENGKPGWINPLAPAVIENVDPPVPRTFRLVCKQIGAFDELLHFMTGEQRTVLLKYLNQFRQVRVTIDGSRNFVKRSDGTTLCLTLGSIDKNAINWLMHIM